MIGMQQQDVTTQKPNLSTLPTELIAAIFDELCIEDAFHLIEVARRFWKIGWPCLEVSWLRGLANNSSAWMRTPGNSFTLAF